MNASETALLQDRMASAAAWVSPAFERLKCDDACTSRLPSLASYSLEGGGKRIRPFLVRAACASGGTDPSRSLPAAAAVEMIHTYSLIHDDLPAMDNDDTRRGRPSLHRHASPAQAVLAGGWLLSEAFSELLRTPLPPASISQMVQRLAKAAGASFLVGGQYMDIHPPASASRAWVESMIGGKTAAMIRVSLELGAIAGGCGRDVVSAVSRLGDRLGHLFQLTDDILDVTGTMEELGKQVSKDSALGKANLVSLSGLESARAEAAALSGELDAALAALPGDWIDVRLLARYLPQRRS